MAEINKPSDINKIWALSGDILAPSDSKIATGWQVEIPPRQYFNYIDNKQDQAIAHINQHGIPVWDMITEYQYSLNGSKSLCMGSDGIIYRAKQVNTNQNPVADTANLYWEIAFPSSSDVYSKFTSDAKYMQRFANLSDLGNTAASRTNLSVYSKAEVDSITTRRLLNIKVFSPVTTTYTPTPGTNAVEVIVQAGGGAGGNIPATSASQFGAAGGGGAGGYAQGFFTSGFSGVSIIVGTGAPAGSAAAGQASSFGSLLLTSAGAAGSNSSASTTGTVLAGGAGGSSSGGNILNAVGMQGIAGISFGTLNFLGGGGGSSRLSGGAGGGASAGAGSAGILGAGGAGATGSNSASALGGAGGNGLIIIREYS